MKKKQRFKHIRYDVHISLKVAVVSLLFIQGDKYFNGVLGQILIFFTFLQVKKKIF